MQLLPSLQPAVPMLLLPVVSVHLGLFLQRSVLSQGAPPKMHRAPCLQSP